MSGTARIVSVSIPSWMFTSAETIYTHVARQYCRWTSLYISGGALAGAVTGGVYGAHIDTPDLVRFSTRYKSIKYNLGYGASANVDYNNAINAYASAKWRHVAACAARGALLGKSVV